MNCIVNTVLSGALILLLLGAIDMLYSRSSMLGEQTRRIIHVAAGLVALSFPVLICTHWHLLILAVIFTTLMFVTYKLGLLPSVHRISRPSVGAFLYPVAIYIPFLVFSIKQDSLYFFIPVLIMALCDPLAAWVGTSLHKSQEGGLKKTVAGSAAFAIAAFIISLLLFITASDFSIPAAFVWSICIALITAGAERWSYYGWDNLTIPLAAIGGLVVVESLSGAILF